MTWALLSNTFAASKKLACLSTFLLFLPSSVSAVDKDRWDLYSSVSLSYDDNVPLESEDTSRAFPGNTSSSSLAGSISGSYQLFEQGLWELRGHGSLYGNFNDNNDVNDFDRFTFKPGISLSRRLFIGGRPATWHISPDYRQDDLGGNSFSKLFHINTGIKYARNNSTTSNLVLNVSRKNFSDDGSDSAFSSRDANTYKLSIGETYRLPRLQSIQWQYRYTDNQAEGANFDYEAHGLSLSYGRPLLNPFIRLNLGINVDRKRYDNFQTNPKRKQKNWASFISVSAPLSRSVTLSANYQHQQFNGNRSQFDSQRNLFTLSLGYKF